ncbi:protease inhibitor I9 family protein [Streptomyces sp. BR123]|uniref:protease inhibitor I9 family protein n=1 Tax=Streptomyces sp. BR123 TaxID=2749828 RepID=UPI0015C4BFC5|nr:protease inhibitor I9 family protein [Streptomyces sp. BR123]NXY99368.1 protease inhibitor I9 family protein [Streptomyces sp. BR123]
MRTSLGRALPAAFAAALAAVVALPATSTAAGAPADPATREVREVREVREDPADWPTYIVTVDRALDPADVASRVDGVHPLHVYRDTLNGFAARLDPDQLESLESMPDVESIEEDGTVSADGPGVSWV